MENLFSKHKLILFGTLGVLVALIALYMLSSSSTPSTSLLTKEGTENASNASDQGLVGTLLTLRAVTLSGTILSDPAFVALKDFGIQIVPEPVGRENPFAPLSRGVVQAATSTPRTNQLFSPKPPARP